MRKIKYYISVLLSVFVVSFTSSCKDDPETIYFTESLDIDDSFSQLNFIAKQSESQIIKFATNRNWGIRPSHDWIHVSSLTGEAGEQTVEIKLDDNNEYVDRTGSLILTYGRQIYPIAIKQFEANGVVASKKHFDLKKEAQTLAIDLMVNAEKIEVVIPEDAKGWIEQVTAPQARAMSPMTLYFDIAANRGLDIRKADLIFVNQDARDTVSIRQYDASELIIEKTRYDLDCTDKDFVVDVNTNVPIDVVIPDDVTWLKYSGNNGRDYKFHMNENTGKEVRKTKILFQNKEKELAINVSVSQEEFNTIAVIDNYETGNVQAALEKLDQVTVYTKIVLHGPAVNKKDIDDMRKRNFRIYDLYDTETTVFEGRSWAGDANVRKVIFPKNLTEIGTCCFQSSGLAGDIFVPKTVQYMENAIFMRCHNMISCEFEEGVPILPEMCFFQSSNLKTLILPTTISQWTGRVAKTFEGCNSLKEINLPEGMSIIGCHGFFRSKIEKVRIPSTITNWPSDGEKKNAGFHSCFELQRVELADGLKTLGNRLFENCYKLSTIVSESKVPPVIENNGVLGPKMSKDVNLTILVPKGSRDAYQNAPGWKQYKGNIKEY